MSLGKRPRVPMKRTTSMSDLGPKSSSELEREPKGRQKELRGALLCAPSGRRTQRRSAGDLVMVETALFLRACGLCKRRLGHDLDIFIYRGELAFCSLECRQKLINSDERKGECVSESIKVDAPSAKASSETSGGIETAAAA